MLSQSSHRSPTNIFTLPSELVEWALVQSAASGFPQCIAGLSQTCKYFRNLIYDSPDHHLWRQVFLTTFDDPRVLEAHLQLISRSHGEHSNHEYWEEFRWREEYTQRIKAVTFAKKYAHVGENHARSPDEPSAGDIELSSQDEGGSSALLSYLEALQSALLTTLPLMASSLRLFNLGLPLSIPPLLVLLSSPDSYPIQFPSELLSSNTKWVEELLHRGYPLPLSRRVFIADRSLEDATTSKLHSTDWEKTKEGFLFYKLLFYTGYLPVPVEEMDKAASSSLREPSAEPAAPFTPTSPESVSTPQSPIASPKAPETQLNDTPSPDEQLAMARVLARRKVYDIGYLTRERRWGPFLPISFSVTSTNNDLGRVRLEINGDGIFNIDDPDYEPSNDEDSDEDIAHPMFEFFNRDQGAVAESSDTDSEILTPDYNYLASARTVVEANMRELLHPSPDNSDPAELAIPRIVNALSSLECIRFGGAPGFLLDIEPSASGKSLETECPCPSEKRVPLPGGECEGWDWAGVTGEWRRTICWLDYRDLIIHNVQIGPSRFNDPALQETARMFPMTLRVKCYSAPVRSSLSTGTTSAFKHNAWLSKLPIIHVEGESTGSDLGENTIRRLSGTVSVIGDGAVRWSLTSSNVDDESPEWVSEGIQVGGIGSALGVIGMWTGAEHARMDPLGPFWSWKVGVSPEVDA